MTSRANISIRLKGNHNCLHCAVLRYFIFIFTGLRHDDSVMMSDLCTNIVWLETYIRTLEHMDNTMYRIQQLHFEMANTLAHIMETRLKKRYGM